MSQRMLKDIGQYNTAKDGILYIGIYHPWGDGQNPDFDDFSQKVMNVKTKYGLNWSSPFVKNLREIMNLSHSYVISVMPSHKQGLEESGIRKIAELLCSPPIIDGTDVIIRKTTILKKTSGGPRSIETELPTLALAHQEKVRNKDVLLLDDVTYTGTSLNSGRILLKRAGARVVACIALGKAG